MSFSFELVKSQSESAPGVLTLWNSCLPARKMSVFRGSVRMTLDRKNTRNLMFHVTSLPVFSKIVPDILLAGGLFNPWQ